MLVYSYLQLHSTVTEAEKAISFKNNRATTALLALFAVEEQVKLFVAKQVLLFCYIWLRKRPFRILPQRMITQVMSAVG